MVDSSQGATEASAPGRTWYGGGGLRLAGDVWGDPAAQLVILLHGGGQTRHAWQNTGLRLADRGFFVVAVDARGHGDSEWDPHGRYGHDAMVDDLVALLDQLGGSRPVVVGASMGGAVGLIATGEGRVAATALVLIDVAPRLEPHGAARIQAFMDQRPEGFASLEEVADAIAAYQPQRARQRDLEGLMKNVRPGDDGRYRWHWDPRIRVRQPDLAARAQRLEAAARNVDVPVLLVRGGLSDMLTEQGAREFLAMCPHATYVNVEGAGHMVAGDRNDVFASAIAEFIEEAVMNDPRNDSTAL